MRPYLALILLAAGCSENRAPAQSSSDPVVLSGDPGSGTLGDPGPGDSPVGDGAGGDAAAGDSLAGDPGGDEGPQVLTDFMLRGVFTMDTVAGEPGEDLAVIAGVEHEWFICLRDISTGVVELGKTRLLYAESFEMGFVGPNEEVLNDVLVSQLTRGALSDGAYAMFKFRSVGSGETELPPSEDHVLATFYIWPEDNSDGAFMQASATVAPGELEELGGLPVIDDFSANGVTAIYDRRGEIVGNLLDVDAVLEGVTGCGGT